MGHRQMIAVLVALTATWIDGCDPGSAFTPLRISELAELAPTDESHALSALLCAWQLQLQMLSVYAYQIHCRVAQGDLARERYRSLAPNACWLGVGRS